MTQLGTPPPATPAGNSRLLLVAIALGVATVIVLNLYIVNVRSEVAGDGFIVYRLTKSVEPGTRLRARDVEAVPMPERFRSTFHGVAVTENELSVRLEEPILRPASAGDFLMYNLFTPLEGDYADTKITPGKRLISLPVSSKTAPGAIRPGMWVDLDAAFGTGKAVPEVLPVLEYQKVVAVGQQTVADLSDGDYRGTSSFRTITIEVLPEDAATLSMISRLALSDFEIRLRNPADTSLVRIPSGGINPDVLELLEKGVATPGKGGRR